MSKFEASRAVSPALVASPEIEASRRLQIGQFFKDRRLQSGVSIETLTEALELDGPEVLRAYESGELAMPVDNIFALTNLLNIAPEEVMDLVHELYLFGAD